MDYIEFLENKIIIAENYGFEISTDVLPEIMLQYFIL